MPIKFEKDKFQCEIVVDPPPQGSELFLGESIVGRVKVHATDPASIRGIILNYTVREQFSRVTMSENVDATARLAQQCGSHLRHRMRCLLLGSTNHPPIEVKAGEYVYPFIISVPDNVPPSCPPVVLGTGDRWCGCCGCNCGPRTANVVGVEHMLSLEIIIPYSFLDKNDVFKPVTVWKPTHPSTLLYNPPRSAQQNSAPTSCAACPCECCSTGLVQSCRRCLETKIPGNFTIEVTNGILALSDPQPIGFSVRGTMRCPFLAQLVRQCRVMFPGHRHPVICKAVLSHCECPPIGSNGMSSGTFPTAHLAANRNSYPATMRGAVLDVSYFVEIQPHFYNEREGCCVDYPRGRKVSVPIDVFHCTSLRAPAPPGQSISVRAMTVPTSYTPPGPGQERDAIELGVVFSYAPPAGFEGDFVPAGPILEPLGPPVWGTLIMPT